MNLEIDNTKIEESFDNIQYEYPLSALISFTILARD
jgi:hypothetical protein